MQKSGKDNIEEEIVRKNR